VSAWAIPRSTASTLRRRGRYLPSPRGHVRLLLVAAFLLVFLAPVLGAAPAADAQTAGCSTSGPTGGAYTVTLCFTAPTGGQVLAADANVTVSISVVGANPGIRRITYYMDGARLLTAFGAPYSFVLPTTKWVDGARALRVEAWMRDDFVTGQASANVVFNNGITVPPTNTNQRASVPGTTPAPGTPFVLTAAGDGPDGAVNAAAVSDMIVSWNPNMFLFLGDVYESGTKAEFHNWYGRAGQAASLFGRLRSITNPAVGNHEYSDGAAPGYFDYWDNVPNYYSFDAGGWHFVSLNSTGVVPTLVGSAQYNWLRNDLNRSTAACTMAYFHHPLFNIGPEGSAARMNDVWGLLAQKGVDVVLTGHDHDYQRWYPLDANGVRNDASGVTQFVVGTAGHGTQTFLTPVAAEPRVAVGFDSADAPRVFGALRAELNSAAANFAFVNTLGQTLDAGSIPCSGAPADTIPPTPPTGLTAAVPSGDQVNLGWVRSSDAVGVAGYALYRDGARIATLNPAQLSYTDRAVFPGTTHTYAVDAFDAAGNRSAQSTAAVVTTPTYLVLRPDADTYVIASSPDANFGGNIALRVNTSTDTLSYLRFTVPVLTAPVAHATLRVYSNTTSGTGFDVRGVADNSWAETTITYSLRPPVGAPVGSSGAISTGTWATVDVTSLVGGSGPKSLALTNANGSQKSFSSREGANPPELVVDLATGT
jgi:hypothetical protein